MSSSQAKPSLTANAANAANVGGKAMNSFKKAVAIKADSEEAKPLMATSNGRYITLPLLLLNHLQICSIQMLAIFILKFEIIVHQYKCKHKLLNNTFTQVMGQYLSIQIPT